MVALIKRHKRQEREILKALPWFFALLLNSNINTLNQYSKNYCELTLLMVALIKDGPGPVMVSDTLCPAVHILGT